MLLDSFNIATLPAETQSLREEVRTFIEGYEKKVPVIEKAKSWMGVDPDFSRSLAEKGWLGVSLPTEYGGQGLDALSRFVIVEELLGHSMPVGAHWIADRQSGPLIMKYGTETQKRYFLPKICAAEAFFCIGMSEPNSGSDLASIRTRAERTTKGWRLNGQKIWTTNAHGSHYMIALARTSGSAEDRHSGLSQFIIALESPGIDIRKIPDLTGDHHFNEVFFNDVMLGESSLIGTEGNGWTQVINELAYERSGPERIYSSILLCDLWLDFLRERGAPSSSVTQLGEIVARLIVLRHMSISLATQMRSGLSPITEAALVKDLGTELEQDIPAQISAELFRFPHVSSPGALRGALSYISQISPTFSLRGGTREILRGMIARDLGLR